jgi:hypothetical protein
MNQEREFRKELRTHVTTGGSEATKEDAPLDQATHADK